MDTWTLFAILKVIMMSVNEWKYIQIHMYVMVLSVLQNLSGPETNYLSPSMKTSFCFLVFLFSLPSVHFLFPIWRFPTQCTQQPASIRRCHLPVFRAVSCARELLVIASLTIYKKKKILKSNCISGNPNAHEKEERVVEWGGRGGFLFVLLFILFLLDASET